jgi:hypothetical protein
VDFIRVPYRTDCQFNTTGPASKIQWYFAAPDAEPLPYHSQICNLKLEVDKEAGVDVGEQWGSPWKYRAFVYPPGSGKGRFCGTQQDFEVGGTYDPEAPPVVYGTNGLPHCCGGVVVPRGGAGAGGVSAPVVPVVRYSRGGGAAGGFSKPGFYESVGGGGEGGGPVAESNNADVTTGGGGEGGGPVVEVIATADVAGGGGEGGGPVVEVIATADVAGGGGEGGGPVVETWGFTDVAGGGGEGGGPVVEVIATADVAGGGGEGGGPVPQLLAFVDAPGGGGVGGGPVPQLLAFVDAPGGGGVGGGIVPQVIAFVDVPVKGGMGGGAVVEVMGFADSPGGGGVGGGPVVESWTPGGVTPGTSCATAGAITLGTTYTGPPPTGLAQDWFSISVTNGTTYRVRKSLTGGPGLLLVLYWQGTSCAGLSPLAPTPGSLCDSFVAPYTGTIWLQINPQPGASSYSITPDVGSCP